MFTATCQVQRERTTTTNGCPRGVVAVEGSMQCRRRQIRWHARREVGHHSSLSGGNSDHSRCLSNLQELAKGDVGWIAVFM